MTATRIYSWQFAAARAALRLTQRQLADLAGVDDGVIRHFEKGQRCPPPAIMAKILAAVEASGIKFIERGIVFRARR